MNSIENYSLSFPYSLGEPMWSAGFRSQLDHFVVDEVLGFLPSGEGEHLLLQVRKRNENTRWLAALLASYFGVEEAAIGYCGLKDRRAITSQWFSVHLPKNKNIIPLLPTLPNCEILQAARHHQKLRRGMHEANHFVITLDYAYKEATDNSQYVADIDARLNSIAQQGVPNYFGEQRFGRNANNLNEVAAIVSQRRPRFQGKRGGLYLSAARSWLFNGVLASRVESGQWLTTLDGPLWGRGRSSVTADVIAEENTILADWQHWCLALEHSGLTQERRLLVLRPQHFSWQWHKGCLRLAFSLAPGCYATAVLRELAILNVPPTDSVY